MTESLLDKLKSSGYCYDDQVYRDKSAYVIDIVKRHLDLDSRIKHCNERIEFWKNKPETQQVWIGVKQEVERIKAMLEYVEPNV
jgi:hypothetical protein